MNATRAQEMRQDWSRPWVFMATPSLHTDQPGTCPPGAQMLELATTANYDYFRELRDRDQRADRPKTKEVEDRLIRHRGAVPPSEPAQAHSPARGGLCLGRLKALTPWKNFYCCSSGDLRT